MDRSSLFAIAVIFAVGSAFAAPRTEMDAPPTIVENSRMTNSVSGDTTATDGSVVNRGVEAVGSGISDSTISNNSVGNVNAVSSRVDTGVTASGTSVRDSNLSANSSVSINAVNSSVSAGAIQLSGANGADVSTNVNAAINARNSVVNVGTVKGQADGVSVSTNVSASVDAKGKTVNIGTVNLKGDGGSGYKGRHEGSSPGKETSIGNVTVEGGNVKEINTTVGSAGGSVGERLKTRNLANTFKEDGGVDPSGTKNVYVSKAEAAKAARKGGGAGNTVIGDDEKDRKVRKVNTYVDN